MGKRGAASKGQASSPGKASGDASTSRFVDRRDLEGQALRSIKEHFPFMADLYITTMARDGMTLLARVMEDRASLTGTAKKLGASYWNEVRQIYSDGLNEKSASLEVKAPTDPICDDLIRAMESARATNTTKRSQQALIAFFQHVQTMNQREFVGCCKHIVGIRPAANPVSQSLVLEFMRCCTRCGFQNAFASEIQSCSEVFDSCLLQSLAAFKKAMPHPSEWWDLYKREGSLVLDAAAMERVLQAGDRWLPVAQDISNLTVLSRTGSKLFGRVAPQVISEKAEIELGRRLAGLEGKPLTVAILDEVRKGCLQWAAEAKAESILQCKRNIMVEYRSLRVEVQWPAPDAIQPSPENAIQPRPQNEIQPRPQDAIQPRPQMQCAVPVQTFADELTIRLAAYVKSHVVGSPALPELTFEVGLFTPRANFAKADAAVLEQYVNVRSVVEKILKEVQKEGNIIVDRLKRKHTMFCSLDRSWWLEYSAFEAMNGEAGLKRVQGQILDALPKPKALKRPSHSLQLIEQVKSGATYRFGNATVKSTADSIKEIVACMVAGEAPAIKFLTGSEWCAQVLAALELFCQHTTKAKSSQLSTVVTGKAAIKEKLAEAVEKQKKTTLAFEDLGELHIFSWLLEPADLVSLRNLSNDLVSTVTSGSKKRAATGGSSSSTQATDKESAKKKAKDAEKQAVMSIFG